MGCLPKGPIIWICLEEVGGDLGSAVGISQSLLYYQKLEIPQQFSLAWLNQALQIGVVGWVTKGFETGKGLLVAVGWGYIANNSLLNSETWRRLLNISVLACSPWDQLDFALCKPLIGPWLPVRLLVLVPNLTKSRFSQTWSWMLKLILIVLSPNRTFTEHLSYARHQAKLFPILAHLILVIMQYRW